MNKWMICSKESVPFLSYHWRFGSASERENIKWKQCLRSSNAWSDGADTCLPTLECCNETDPLTDRRRYLVYRGMEAFMSVQNIDRYLVRISWLHSLLAGIETKITFQFIWTHHALKGFWFYDAQAFMYKVKVNGERSRKRVDPIVVVVTLRSIFWNEVSCLFKAEHRKTQK